MLKKILYGLSLFIGVPLFTGLLLVNRLAYKKGGLNHHLLYRKHQYLKGIFSSQNLLLFSAGFALVAVLLLFWILRDRIVKQKIAKAFAFFYSLAFILCSHLPVAKQLIVYPYLLMSLLLCFCASLMAVPLAARKSDRVKPNVRQTQVKNKKDRKYILESTGNIFQSEKWISLTGKGDA